MKKLILICIPFYLSELSYADSWVCKGEIQEIHLKNSLIKCTYREFCERGSRKYPDANIMCKANGKDGFFRNLGATAIKLSEKGDYVLGLSNTGFHEHALWLLRSNGELVFSIPHSKHGVKYCAYSITIQRKWFDFSDDRVKFTYKKGKLHDITAKLCDGKQASIVNDQFRDRLNKQELAEKLQNLWSQVHDMQQKDIKSGTNKAYILKHLKAVPVGVCNSTQVYEEFNGKGGWVLEDEWGSFSVNTEGECR